MSTGGPASGNLGAASSRVRPGDVVAGKFRVDRLLGEGGMGIVFAATHIQLDEPVALKFLLERAATNSESAARFTREARAAAKLKSEHVARVLDFGVTEDGTPYIAMEYLQGQDLAARMRTLGPLDVTSAAEYVIQACEGLAEAHARGIIHRDIKPENLFLVDRSLGWKSIKILDFGISKLAGGAAGPSNLATQSIMGSPCYMSPEQLRSTASVDHRTDIWSLGATLHELLTGRTVYDSAKTLPELVAAILETPAPPVQALRDFSPELIAIVGRCMEKDRERRFASTADLAVALLPFAPKRARTAVERAVAMSHSAGLTTSQDVVAVEAPTLPPPASASPVPPAAPPAGPSAHASTQMSTAGDASPPTRRRRRGAILVLSGFALLLAGGLVTLGLVHRAGSRRGAAAPVEEKISAQPPSQAAATLVVTASTTAASTPADSVAVGATSLEAGAERPAASASSRHAAHGPPPGPSATPEPRPARDLDIRMTR